MRKFRRSIIALAMLIAMATHVVPASAQQSLTPHSAVYKIRISILGGQLKTRLVTTDQGYIATHVVTPTGISKIIARGYISESSEFYAVADGVRPTKYRSDDTLSRDKTRVSIEFDWDSGEAYGTVNGEEVSSSMDDLAHDRVSIQYELMHDLLHDGPSATYTMFEIDELRTVNVRNIGARRVKISAGEFDAIGIQHQAEGSKRITTLWCVEQLDYLPVIIEQHRKGKLRVRATLSKYSPATGS